MLRNRAFIIDYRPTSDMFAIIHAWRHERAAQPQFIVVRDVSGSEAGQALIDVAALQT